MTLGDLRKLLRPRRHWQGRNGGETPDRALVAWGLAGGSRWFSEVPLVEYCSDLIDFAGLVGRAAEVKCARKVWATEEAELASLGEMRLETGLLTDGYRAAKESDQKRQLRGTAFAQLDLDPMQATKVNAWARRDREKGLGYLSPRQRAALK